MPTYVYQVILKNEKPEQSDGQGEVFEVIQKMSDDQLTHHPETGEPVRKLIQVPHISTQWSHGKEKNRMSDSNLASKGFTKYEKTGDGSYVKTAGDGPKTIGADGGDF